MLRRLATFGALFAVSGGAFVYAACSSSGASDQPKTCVTTADCKGSGTCVDGVCEPDAPIVRWKSLPRSSPCRAYSECPFEVTATGDIDHYEWDFSGADGGVITQEPSTTHKYGPGAAHTRVTAFAKNGTQGSVEGDDDICVDGKELQCQEDLISCCFGACTPEGGCR